MIFLFAESLYPVKTKYIVADFSHGKEIYDEIEKQLSGIPVGILGKFQGLIFSTSFPRHLRIGFLIIFFEEGSLVSTNLIIF